MFYLTNRLHVDVRLFRSRSHMTSKRTAGVERIRSENVRLRPKLKGIRFEFNETRVSDDGNLCPLWLVILKSISHIGDTL